MSPRVWIPVAFVGLLGGAGAAYVQQMTAVGTGQQSDNSSAVATGQTGTQQKPGEQTSEKQGDGGQSDNSQQHAEQRLSAVDRKLPDFELPTLDQTLWNTQTLNGKPWVINFWATWCPPCIEEIPSMNVAYEYLEPKGIGMLAINAGEGAVAVEQFLQRVAIDFPNVLGDTNTLINWSVRALPTTIVVNAEGEVVYEALGPREWDDERLLQHVVDLL